MKKKLSLFLIAILFVPVFALFGCGNTESYKINVKINDSQVFRNIDGSGVYEEGKEVTLTASTNSSDNFITWVLDSKKEIVEDSTYKIENTKDSNGNITSSVLKFKSSANTAGTYTAVFDDNNMQYAKLYYWMISKEEDAEPAQETETDPLMNVNLSIYQNSSSSYKTENSVDVKENVAYQIDTNSVAKLEYGSNYSIQVNAKFTTENGTLSPIFSSSMTLGNSTEKVDNTNYSYKVDYSNGMYKTQYQFAIRTQTYYLTVAYKNLGK